MCVKFDDFIEVFKKIKWYDIVVEINKVLNLLRLMEDEEQEIYVFFSVVLELVFFYKELERYDQFRKVYKN